MRTKIDLREQHGQSKKCSYVKHQDIPKEHVQTLLGHPLLIVNYYFI